MPASFDLGGHGRLGDGGNQVPGPSCLLRCVPSSSFITSNRDPYVIPSEAQNLFGEIFRGIHPESTKALANDVLKLLLSSCFEQFSIPMRLIVKALFEVLRRTKDELEG